MTYQIYKITEKYQQVMQDIYESDEINEENLAQLKFLESELQEGAINVASLIKNMEIEVEGVDNAIKEMRLRKESAMNKIQRLKTYILTTMQNYNLQEITGSSQFAIKIRKCPPSVKIIDEEVIPFDFKKIKTETVVDKLLLAEHLKAGEEIAGVELETKLRVEIK